MQILVNLLSRLSGQQKKLTEMAEAVAFECSDTVWQSVLPRISKLSDSEARGYIRARAMTVVSREVDEMLSGAESWRHHRVEIAEMAIESVVRLVVNHRDQKRSRRERAA